MTPELIMQIIAGAGGAISVYAAIRADLATLHERTVNTAKVADRAHERIDELQAATQPNRRHDD